MDKKQALLEQLHGLQAPVVSKLPALGWWLVAALLCAAIIAYRLYKNNYQRRYWFRQAMHEINTIRNNTEKQNPQTLLARCSVLARKLALVATPRAKSAGVVGKPWLQQLDSICGEPVFSGGAGQLLVQAPYQLHPTIEADQIIELCDALELLAKAKLSRRMQP
ncbi:MAG: DUF4381 domain-containing protein [Granulosicoccaceae bacterium]